jgi:hypothetical protein
MPTYHAEITEIRLEASGALSGQVRVEQEVRIEPGQYLLAQPLEDRAALPRAVFAYGREDNLLDLAAPLPPAWTTGTHLSLRGPLGNGFRLPPGARKVALAALDGCPQRLLPLVQPTLEQGGDVALYCSSEIPHHLPLAVEVLPLNQLSQAHTWADYLALDAGFQHLSSLRSLLGIPAGQRLPIPAQVLLVTRMPCGGAAECGVCAVLTTQGWRLACKDGPVFNLDILLER